MPRKLNRRRLAVAAAAGASGAIMLAGVTAASASASSPAISGTEHFQFMTTSPNSNASIIATGAFTAGGTDHTGHTADTLVFPTGSVMIAHSNPTGTHTLNPKTCLVTASETGTYKVTGGTGAYTGITGHGTYQLTILAVAARNTTGKCSTTLPPAAWQQLIKGTGPVHL